MHQSEHHHLQALLVPLLGHLDLLQFQESPQQKPQAESDQLQLCFVDTPMAGAGPGAGEARACAGLPNPNSAATLYMLIAKSSVHTRMNDESRQHKWLVFQIER